MSQAPPGENPLKSTVQDRQQDQMKAIEKAVNLVRELLAGSEGFQVRLGTDEQRNRLLQITVQGCKMPPAAQGGDSQEEQAQATLVALKQKR